jgi:D-amino-acid oxidase
MKPKITIIGSGVTGLTTGIVLLEAGYEVQIFTAALPHETTSARAAALWFPFQMGPVDLVNAWSKYSYGIFKNLAQDEGSGIFMRPLLELIAQESDAWWKDALPEEAIRPAKVNELPQGFQLGYVIQVPIIETPIYLDYLVQMYAEAGGKLTLKCIQKIEDIADTTDVIVNCTGLAAKELVGDKELYPIKGQIVKLAPHAEIMPMAADMHLWASETDLAYIIPRSDCIVLGGNVLPDDADLTIDEEATARIRLRCERLDERLTQLQFLKAEVGLRPGRKEIRLEREGKIIHNYGHGGGGYTVSWGCAEAVLDLLRNYHGEISKSR